MIKMNSLTEQEIQLFGHQFEKELIRLHENQETPSHWARMIMPGHKIHEIIQHIKNEVPLPPGKLRSWIESRKFKVFNKPSMGLSDVLMEPTKEKLSMGADVVIPRYLRVVPREDIFDTLLKIHLQHNHSTLRETLHLVRGVISNIPRYLVHKFILLCPVCSNNGATTNSCGLPYTPSRRCMIKARRRRKLMDQFQVDVLDLQGNPDGDYSYILHCMDHITGFHWLFPLVKVEAAEVAQNLVWGIFSLFGFPSELVSDYGKDFSNKVIEQVGKLWPDELHIKNFLDGSSHKSDVTRRNRRNVSRFIDDMAAKKAEQGDNKLRWSEWLPEIQFMLNATVLDVRTGKTPYEKVFRSQPITQVSKTKFTSSGPLPTDHEDQLDSSQQSDQYNEFVLEEMVGGDDLQEVSTLVHGGQQQTVDLATGNLVVMDVGEDTTAGGCGGGGGGGSGRGGSKNLLADSEGYDYETGDGSTYTILSTHQESSETVEDQYVITDDGHYFTSDVQGEDIETSVPSNVTTVGLLDAEIPTRGGSVPPTYPRKLDQLRLEDIEYVDDGSATEKWVTLSADGGELEVAEIRPTIQRVNIAAGSNSNTGYRINVPARKAVYLKDKSSAQQQKIPAEDVDTTDDLSVNGRLKGVTKSFSPVKSHRVIQLSSLHTTGNTAAANTTSISIQQQQQQQLSPSISGGATRRIFSPDRSASSSSQQLGYHATSKHTSPTALKILSAKKAKISPSSAKGAADEDLVRTKILARPQLKIPGRRKAGGNRTVDTKGPDRRYHLLPAHDALEQEEEEEDYEVLSEEEEEEEEEEDDDEEEESDEDEDTGYY